MMTNEVVLSTSLKLPENWCLRWVPFFDVVHSLPIVLPLSLNKTTGVLWWLKDSN